MQHTFYYDSMVFRTATTAATQLTTATAPAIIETFVVYMQFVCANRVAPAVCL